MSKDFIGWLGEKMAKESAEKQGGETSYLLPPASETFGIEDDKEKKKSRKALKKRRSRNSQAPHRYGRKVNKKKR